VQQAIACPPHEDCQRCLPGAMNLPALMKTNRAAGMVISRLESGDQRSSSIGSETAEDALLMLVGVDANHPRSMRISLVDRRFTLVTAQDAAGYMAFRVSSSAMLD
jgi:hypothetical protein